MKGLARDGLIMGGIVVAMTAAGYAFGYLPSVHKIEQIREETATIKQSLEADGEKAVVVPELLRQVEVMKGKYKDFNRRLPQRQELGGFLREISENLSQENLANQTIEPGRPLQEDLFFTLPIVLKFQGSYPSLARFLERIDEMERLTRVQKLVIVPSAGEGVMDITVQLNIYFTQS
jgi:Tfp pilus assembly protein PilO